MPDHDHHHPHGHPHSHDPAPQASGGSSPRGGWSLLNASAVDRLAGAAVILAVMWACVWWALQ